MTVKVTGIYEDLPQNSSFGDLTFISPWLLLVKDQHYDTRFNNPWGASWFQTLVQIADNADMNKVSDKIKVIDNLLPKVDALLVGGAMAYTFLKTQGIEVGKSRVEADKLTVASRILEAAERLKKDLVLPLDHVAAPSPDASSSAREI